MMTAAVGRTTGEATRARGATPTTRGASNLGRLKLRATPRGR